MNRNKNKHITAMNNIFSFRINQSIFDAVNDVVNDALIDAVEIGTPPPVPRLPFI